MTGIVSYGAYIPFFRLKKETTAAAFGKRGGKGAKAVAYCDEDSITMSVAAAADAAGTERKGLAAVFFASASSPYKEKQAATEVAAALDLDMELRTADFANTLRAGSAAMLSAFDLVRCSGEKALVTMSDCRLGAADGKYETELGDGAAAFVVGSDDLLAVLDGCVSIARDSFDMWRAADDTYVRDWDVRFANTQLYVPFATKAVAELMKKLNAKPADFAKVILYAHNDKNRAGVATKLGFSPEQLIPSMYSEIGNTGNAAAALMLCAALDHAKPGERILMLTYGEGADAFAFTVTGKAKNYRARNTVEKLIAHKDESLPYGKYLKWKGMLETEPQKRPAQERSAVPDHYRNFKKNHSLWGVRCTECGLPVFPPQRVCVHCHTADKMEPYCFLDKKATIRTFTVDGLSLSLDSPNILVALEFEGGGKMMTYLVDCKKEDVYVGMPVKPSFRKMFEAYGIQTYFWKVVPESEDKNV